MKATVYESLLEYAGHEDLASSLVQAREEFIERTGPLFESDPSFEHRLTIFLEWFLLDRSLPGKEGEKPVDTYIASNLSKQSAESLTLLEDLSKSRVELLEFRRWKDGLARFKDVVTKKRWVLTMPEIPLGLESGDLIAGRVVNSSESPYLLDSITLFPRAARRVILKAAKPMRSIEASDAEHLDFVHELSFLANRDERYSHVDSREIFKVLLAS